MVENIGKVIVLHKYRVLEYYVFGDEEVGFGIRIVQRDKRKTGEINQAERQNLTRRKEEAIACAKRLAKGVVCPGHLCDILEEGIFPFEEHRS